MTTPVALVSEGLNIYPEPANRRRLRVLVCAHEFSPSKGSECAVGWNLATRLAKYHDVTVLAASGSQPSPSSYREAYHKFLLSSGTVHGLDVHFIDHTTFSRICTRINLALTGMADGAGNRLLFYASLRDWQRNAYRVGRQIGFDSFDVVHQLTPIGFRNPGYMWRSGKPFVLGPISGMYSVPVRFAKWLGAGACLFESIRGLSNTIQEHFAPRIRRAIRSATAVWVVTAIDAQLVRRLGGVEPVPMLECGTPSVPGKVVSYDGTGPLRICWSGRHDAAKALPLLLEAIASSPMKQMIRLTVMGRGPMTNSWKARAESLGLRDIDWRGFLPHDQALAEVASHHCFAHTSVREATGVVILEAIALGIPVICHDACGMAVAVNEACGIKVPFLSPAESVRGFRKAIEKILQQPVLVSELSNGALRRATELTWDANAREISDTYLRVHDDASAFHTRCRQAK